MVDARSCNCETLCQNRHVVKSRASCEEKSSLEWEKLCFNLPHTLSAHGSHWVKYSWSFSRRSQLAHVRNSSQSPFSSFPQHSRLASVTQCGFIVVGFLNPSSSPVNALRVGLGNLLIILDRPQMLVILLGILSQGLSYIYNRACHSLLSSLTIYA